MGNILGVAVTITLFETFRNIYLQHGKVYETAFLFSYRTTMCFGILFGLICLTFAYIAYKPKQSIEK
jgi:preprotein translocase subunit SecG